VIAKIRIEAANRLAAIRGSEIMSPMLERQKPGGPSDGPAAGNAALRFAVGECTLGAILIAATESGIVAIALGDEPDALLGDFRRRFPEAQAGDGDFARTMTARVVDFIETPVPGPGLPLDMRGTEFQRQVWRALCAIPAGATASYRDIAERIGAPLAARAVARACAANPIAVAIPCHRVVRSDGTLSGYRWGIERKRRLLDREAA
jgi:AraC family transcriptional regulator, regulatory protein of adaptative response / methylated-DNA-[protein]-cysteine methyltransferase